MTKSEKIVEAVIVVPVLLAVLVHMLMTGGCP